MKNTRILSLLVFFLILINLSCTSKKESTVQQDDSATGKTVLQSSFGKLPEGKEVYAYTLTNSKGMEVKVINYGGIIVSLKAPDRSGNLEDVVLGYDSLSSYLKSNPYFGALIGRYGNRIAKGKFTLDGTTYSLAQNNGENHLHGGMKGFDKAFWSVEILSDSTPASLKLSYESADGEEGYPGKLQTEVVYTLTADNELKIEYTAIADKKTIVNLTQHSYFNLSGNENPDILTHELMMDADHFLPVDKTLIPTGVLKPVAGTPFDFKASTKIGERIEQQDEQLKFGGGYDHCWILNNYDSGSNSPRKVAALYEPGSGRVMEVFTTEPGLQFYSGNFLDGTLTGKNGVKYTHRYGLCLETQHFPDSPNKPSFPPVVLNPGEVYKTMTVYKFTVK